MYFYFCFFLFSWDSVRIKKKKKIVLLVKAKLNSIEVLISKALIYSNIGHNECVSIKNFPKSYNDIKEEIYDIKTSSVN